MQLTRTKISMTVLSSEPMPAEITIAEVIREGSEGSYVLDFDQHAAESLTADQMREALLAAGNDGTFFDEEIEEAEEDQEAEAR